MLRKREVIDVWVDKGILWIGPEAYPLQNIARATTLKLVPNRLRAFGRFAVQVILWLALGAGAMYALNSTEGDVDRDALAQLASYVVIALVVISTIGLVRRLLGRTYYSMVIETSGTPRTALTSTDKNLVMKIVRQTMEAINNPAAKFHEHVTNINYGNQIYQPGSHNTARMTA
jgi:hypothetical protein